MNKAKVLLVFSLVAISACSNSSKELSEKANLIEKMRTATYQVNFSGVKTETYPRGYEAYNNSSILNVTREYGYLNDNPNELRAARVITDLTTSTYYEAEDGRMYTQVIREDNSVERSYLSYLGTYYRFAAYYASPFDYIDEYDFVSSNTLNSQKSFLLFNYYTGLEQPVKEAKLTFNNDGLVSRVDFTFLSLPVGVATETSIETIETDMTGYLTFDYEIAAITALNPYVEQSSKYETAVNNMGTNYTIISDSNATTSKVVTYVADNSIYVHFDQMSDSMLSNDLYYVKRGNSYRSYIYSGKEWVRDESVEISAILPKLSEISNYIVEDKTDTHLALKENAVAYGADNFLIPSMMMTDGTGLKTDIYLKNNTIDYTTSTFAYYSGNIVIKNNYVNYGSTSLPIWFEQPEV